jgi:hypothetical protein
MFHYRHWWSTELQQYEKNTKYTNTVLICFFWGGWGGFFCLVHKDQCGRALNCRLNSRLLIRQTDRQTCMLTFT